jgi:lipoprotein-anchoring transpeptidase ErfK/SrfK
MTRAGSRSARSRAAWCAVAAAAVVGIASCQSATAPTAAPTATATASGAAAPAVTTPPAQIEVDAGPAARRVRPDQLVTVTAQGGRLGTVAMADADGHAVAGRFSADHASWTSAQRLALRTAYTVRAVAANADGQAARRTVRLRTLTPTDTADYAVLPSGAREVGVGMPVVVQFAGLVDASRRAAIEKQVSVKTSPAVKGSWGWLDARQLAFRPASYWKPGTRVQLKADIAGLETRKGVWTTHDASASFRIGSAMVSTVDVRKHTLTVRRNGKVLRVIPITTGKPGFETRNGIKVILSRETSRQMDAETTGLKKTDPEYYNVKVKYAMRLTWSGEFLHAAPWSVGSQGRANVSHGCTGMSTANAKWLFDRSKMGDVVKYVGSTRPLESYNGYTMWNMSLAQWATHSALA